MKSLDELTTRCIRCGFCLESCPTFLVTGQETESPRGRIYLVRSADEGQIAWEQAKPHIDRCLGCLACETACPSGVDYSEIVEIARDRMERLQPNKAKSALLDATTKPSKLKLQLKLGHLWPGRRVPGFVSRLLSGQSPEADKPTPQPLAEWPELKESELPAVRGQVYLLEGCAMRVLFPRVHQATRRLLRRVGYVVKETSAGCCGALHAHNGHLEVARELSRALIEAMPGDLPVVVNSAGCGSVMKEYGELNSELGTRSLELGDTGFRMSDFGSRVVDISEFLAAQGLAEQLTEAQALGNVKVAYHDACHLAHGQGIRNQPRELLNAVPGLKLIPLPEADVCCGSAGIYNLIQPKLARQLLERKWKNIDATGAEVVALGNPGCHAWIAQAAREKASKVKVMHTAEVLEAAFSGWP